MVIETVKSASHIINRVTVIDATVDLPQNAHSIIKSIHTGKWGGAFSKWLYAITMFIATTLPITGYWLWLKNKKK